MTFVRRHLFSLAIMVCTGVLGQPSVQANEGSINKATKRTASELTIAFISDNRPWTYSNTTDTQSIGLTHELVKRTLESMGHAIKPEFMTPRRVSASLLGHHTDGATLMISPSGAVTPPANFDCSAPYLDIPWHLYYRDDTPIDLPDTDVLLGVVKYPGYEDYYTTFPVTFSAYKSNLQLYRSLKAKRIHGLIGNASLINFWREELSLNVVRGEYLGYTHMTMCFSSKQLGDQARKLALAFTPALTELMQYQPETFSTAARDLFRLYDPMKDGNPDFEYLVEDARKTPTSNRERHTGH